MGTHELINALWQARDISAEVAALFDRKQALEVKRRRRPAETAELQRISARLDQLQVIYHQIGGPALVPARYFNPEAIAAIASTIERGRAVTVRGALHVIAQDEREYQRQRAQRNRERAYQRDALHHQRMAAQAAHAHSYMLRAAIRDLRR